MSHYKMPKNNCVNSDCGGGWVSVTKKQPVKRYIGRFVSGDDNELISSLSPHLRPLVPTYPQDAKFASDGPSEEAELEMSYAAPCPNCNQLARAAYEDGRLAHLLAHRNDPPDEEEIRRRNIEKAKAKWDF